MPSCQWERLYESFFLSYFIPSAAVADPCRAEVQEGREERKRNVLFCLTNIPYIILIVVDSGSCLKMSLCLLSVLLDFLDAPVQPLSNWSLQAFGNASSLSGLMSL